MGKAGIRKPFDLLFTINLRFACGLVSLWLSGYLKKQSQLAGFRPEIYALGILNAKL
jgi:hypothetical protein